MEKETLVLENTVKENVLEVDDNNFPIGEISRREMREKNVWHRASYIYVKNSKNELCIHLRSSKKELYPGHWDVCAGGCMNYGLTDEENATKELAEEYGVQGVKLDFVCSVRKEIDISKSYLSIFVCEWDGEIKVQEEEVQEYKWVTLGQLREDFLENPEVNMKPEGVEVLEMLIKHYGYLKE
ncbi:unnamed protein product [Moneuplotes crassus]|uniref:Nudix hydrolase domain-containing protein n=1 Tax=Euplotes crassus TaxID=5936 RepID=A0AAD1XZA6_EUPCR|nr:unnamed protein product [Moneuplotes crassus]